MRKQLYHIPDRFMSANERRLGRFIRDGEPGAHQGAPEAGVPVNNTPSNTGTATTDSTPANNGGQQFDPASFWNPASAGEGGVPEETSGSATPSTQQQEQPSLGTTLAETLTNMSYSTPVIDATIAQEMSEGSFETFNTRMTDMGRETARQTLSMAVQVMRAVREQIMADVNGQLSGTLSNRDNDAALIAAIPSAANPKVAPMVKSIFDQAMKVSKGDRTAALAMTKEMLKMSNQEFTQDDSLGIPARTASDANSPTASRTNWIEELVGRE